MFTTSLKLTPRYAVVIGLALVAVAIVGTVAVQRLSSRAGTALQSGVVANTAPSVDAVVPSDASGSGSVALPAAGFTPSEGAPRNLYVRGTVSDPNGCTDIDNVQVTVHRTGVPLASVAVPASQVAAHDTVWSGLVSKLVARTLAALRPLGISPAWAANGQNTWRWRLDDGSETTASWITAELTAIANVTKETALRLRFGVSYPLAGKTRFAQAPAVEIDDNANAYPSGNARAFVADPAGTYGYILFDGGLIDKVRLSDRVVVAQLLLAGTNDAMFAAAVDPSGDFAYFANFDSFTIHKVRLSDFVEIGPALTDGTRPGIFSLAISPSGTHAFIGTMDNGAGAAGQLAKLELTGTNAFTTDGLVASTNFGVTGDNYVANLMVDAAGTNLYVVNFDTAIGVLKVRTSDLAVLGTWTGAALYRPTILLGDPASGFVYAASSETGLAKLSTSTMAMVGAEISLGSWSYGIATTDTVRGFAYLAGGSVGITVLKFDLATGTPGAVIDLAPIYRDRGGISAVAIDPARGFAYFETPGPSRFNLNHQVMRVDLRGDGDRTPRLEYAANPGNDCATASGWTPVAVTTGGGEAWQMTASANLTDGAATTDSSQFAPPGLTPANDTFTAGQVKTSDNMTGVISLLPGQYAEVEYSLKATASAANNGDYCFRLTDAGETTLYDYVSYPQATLGDGNLPPLIGSVGISPASPTTAQAVTLSVTGTDPEGAVSAIALLLDGTDFDTNLVTVCNFDPVESPAVCSFDVGALAAGGHTAYAMSLDDHYAESALSAGTTFIVSAPGGNQAPAVGSVSVTPPSPTAAQAVTLAATGTDAEGAVVSVSLYLDGTAAGNLAHTCVVSPADSPATCSFDAGTLAVGAHVLYAKATDDQGLASGFSAGTSFTVTALPSGSGGVEPAHFIWRHDDGGEAVATAVGARDAANLGVAKGTTQRLRFAMQSEGNGVMAVANLWTTDYQNNNHVTMDPAGRYAYLSNSMTYAKVSVTTGATVDSFTLPSDRQIFTNAIDATGTYAYLAVNDTTQARLYVMRVALADMTVDPDILWLGTDETFIDSSLIEGQYLYLGAEEGGALGVGIIRIDLTDFDNVTAYDRLELGADQYYVVTLNSDGTSLYAGTYANTFNSTPNLFKIPLANFLGGPVASTFACTGDDDNVQAVVLSADSSKLYLTCWVNATGVFQTADLSGSQNPAGNRYWEWQAGGLDAGGYPVFLAFNQETSLPEIVRLSKIDATAMSAMPFTDWSSRGNRSLAVDPINNYAYAVSETDLDSILTQTDLSKSVAYALEYAVNPGTCSAASAWTPVPATPAAGGEAWQMAASAHYSVDGSTTTALVGFANAALPFASGTWQNVASVTAPLRLGVGQSTEIEYSLAATAGAADGAYCFRLTDDGAPFASYPVYAGATIGSGSSGPTSATCPADANNCYVATVAKAGLAGCGGAGDYDATFEVVIPVANFADPTDAGSPHAAETWEAVAAVSDVDGLTAALAAGFELQSLAAFAVAPSLIDYGTIALGATSAQRAITFTNTGNRAVNSNVRADGDMHSSLPGFSDVLSTQTHFSASAAAAWADGTPVATADSDLPLALPQQTVDAGPAPTASAYFFLKLPTSGVRGTYTNMMYFTAYAP